MHLKIVMVIQQCESTNHEKLNTQTLVNVQSNINTDGVLMFGANYSFVC